MRAFERAVKQPDRCAILPTRASYVDILVEEVTEAAGATGVAGLRAEGAHPHEIAGLDLHPVLVEAIDGLAFHHIEAMLHDMGFHEGDHRARLQHDDIDVHVEAHIRRVVEAGGAPATAITENKRLSDVLALSRSARSNSQVQW